ncbi:MAG: glycosyltransferase [Flavobacterium sp.]
MMKNKSAIQRNSINLIEEDKKPTSNIELPEILFISSFPPRECGIATYSQDLIAAVQNKFKNLFSINVCALEMKSHKHSYPNEVKYVLETDCQESYIKLAKEINESNTIEMVLVQHEFGLFKTNEDDFGIFLNTLKKPIILVFHTVLPQPDKVLNEKVQKIITAAEAVIVMTNASKKILTNDYSVSSEKISIIPHGTHLVEHLDKRILKEKYQLSGKKVLSTFGLLSSGKSIETTLNALPNIINNNKDVMFLIIGKTHPSVLKQEGEQYRMMLEAKIETLKLQENVKFINQYLPLNELLEYLQLTDVYLFTSKDPHQAVSGTFAYAISCGCPIISTPIPHALEVLQNDSGIVIDFENSEQLAQQVIRLLNDEQLCKNIIANGLHKMAPNAWENSAINHAMLFGKICNDKIHLRYRIPEINLKHIKKLTTRTGMIQFSILNEPDISSGYTLDDNARALIVMCQHFELTQDRSDLDYIERYFNFIKRCLQTEGYFLNYVDYNENFTEENKQTNLSDSNGRAIWALGYLVSISDLLPESLAEKVQKTMDFALSNVHKIHSPRAMGFVIKGIYYNNLRKSSERNISIVKYLGDRLVQMFKHESNEEWLWFESYLTYANSVLSEALVCAWLVTNDEKYKKIAKTSFDFLLSKIFKGDRIKVISNKGWMYNKGKLMSEENGGEQPIDVAYTILALNLFYDVFKDKSYLDKMKISFDWFLGKNHLNQIIYNPCTGGCYDGLETDYVNLNQGAESTLSYLMARLTMEKVLKNKKPEKQLPKDISRIKKQNQFV